MSSNLPITIVAFLFTLGLVVIVHELGHFVFCKLFGVYVKTFSIGIGPKILRKRFGETEYTLSAIPFGGYVKMAGEGIMEEIQDTGTWEERKYPLGTEQGNAEAAALEQHIPVDRHFTVKPAWQRLLVFIAGPLFNLVLAFLLYVGVIYSAGEAQLPVTRIGQVEPASAAAEAGFEVGDRIMAVDGEPVAVWGDILEGVFGPSLDDPADPVRVSCDVDRGGERVFLELTPRVGEDGRLRAGLGPWDTEIGLVQRGGPGDGIGLREGDRILALDGNEVTSFDGLAAVINHSGGREVIVQWERDGEIFEAGVQPEMAEVLPDSMLGRIFIDRRYTYLPVGLGTSITGGWRATWRTVNTTIETLRGFVTRQYGIKAVGGPIRIGQVAGEMLRWSFSHLLQFIAFFSVNLFLLNLLPIPVLDGGHVLFLIIEAAIGRSIPERVQAIATQLGLITLLVFMTFVVVLDVLKVTGN